MTDIIVTLDRYAPPQFRYVATVGEYDLDCTYGRGRTPLDAIVDLLDQVDEPKSFPTQFSSASHYS